MKKRIIEKNIKLDKIVGGGQTIGQLSNGKKVFAWGGLPRETVDLEVTKSKSSHAEAIVTAIIEASKERIEPLDEDSYLSTSPWQIISFDAEQKYKSELIKEAFALQNIQIEEPEVISDNKIFYYRNKMEYSFWWDKDSDSISLAFFKRGTHNKQPVAGSSLPMKCISKAADGVVNLINSKKIDSRMLKTLMIRSTQNHNVVAQLYVKDNQFPVFSTNDFNKLGVYGLEIIYSNPKSPASIVTSRLQKFGDLKLTDEVLGRTYSYSAEGFFQVNLPMYELVLKDIGMQIDESIPTVDMYCGVGTIGLSVGSEPLTLVESNEYAAKELQNNLTSRKNLQNVTILNTESEKALNTIEEDINLILDPPRAGCHDKLIDQINLIQPKNIIYLSCNPITQARDISRLQTNYNVVSLKGYNFFPRTPHIENLVILQRK